MHRRLLPLMSCVGLLVALQTLPVVAQSDRPARLSLAECLSTALDNNLDLVTKKVDPDIAGLQIETNKADFDGIISTGLTYTDSDANDDITRVQPDPTDDDDDGVPDNPGVFVTTFEPGGTDFRQWNGDVKFEHTLQFGADYSLTYAVDDVENVSTGIQRGTNFFTQDTFEQDSGGFTFSYNMPLLAGFGKEVNTINILLARGGLEISKEDLRQSAMETAQAVEDAYWNVLAAREELRISRLSLERAQDLLELNKKKVEVGTLAPIEITEAEAGVASTVESVILAETKLEDTEDDLLQLLSVPHDDRMWTQSIEPTDRPSYNPMAIDLESAIATALDRRPEMAVARQRHRDNQLSERVQSKQVRHGLALNASVTPDKRLDSFQVGGLVNQPNSVASSDTASTQTDWNLSLRYSYPLRNRRAKNDYAIAKLNTRKSDLEIQSLEQALRVGVRKAVRAVESGLQRIEAARKNVELQQEKLNAEEKKYDNGMSTSFEVLTFQNDLADAELREIQARLDYVKSLTALELAKGTLLEARGLRME